MLRSVDSRRRTHQGGNILENPKGLLQKVGRRSRPTGNRERETAGRPRLTSRSRIRNAIRQGNGLPRPKIGGRKLRLVWMMKILWSAQVAQPYCRYKVRTYEGSHLPGKLPSARQVWFRRVQIDKSGIRPRLRKPSLRTTVVDESKRSHRPERGFLGKCARALSIRMCPQRG